MSKLIVIKWNKYWQKKLRHVPVTTNKLQQQTFKDIT